MHNITIVHETRGDEIVQRTRMLENEMKVLKNLDYAIVRKDGMAYVYDFS